MHEYVALTRFAGGPGRRRTALGGIVDVDATYGRVVGAARAYDLMLRSQLITMEAT